MGVCVCARYSLDMEEGDPNAMVRLLVSLLETLPFTASDAAVCVCACVCRREKRSWSRTVSLKSQKHRRCVCVCVCLCVCTSFCVLCLSRRRSSLVCAHMLCTHIHQTHIYLITHFLALLLLFFCSFPSRMLSKHTHTHTHTHTH